ncbi:exo-alpha-sialidase [Actinoplanes sp. NBC_00393]|uniref:sialidase family protein n=1 Tax=Actinoplanes sp. NBC_00393 TaxID=2975953 RepID=UPI002E1EDEBF
MTSSFDGVLRPDPADPRRTDAWLAAPTVQSHASFLATLPDGDLGLVWFGGTQEGVGDISIWFSRLAPGADKWSTPEQLSDDPRRSEQNPILFPTPAGELWLLYTAQRAGNQDTAEVRRRVSADSGRTWGPAHTLFPADERSGVFVRQPIVVTDSGRWLLGIFRCVTVPGERWAGDADTSSVLISDDQGATWREVPVPDSVGCVHMNIADLGGGRLFALFRSRWADHIYASRSDDGGETWSVPQPTELPNNNSSIQQCVLADGRLALVYNHSSRLDATSRRVSLYDEIDDEGLVEGGAGETSSECGAAFWGAPRAPMTLAFSSDQGATWQRAGNLDEGDGYCLTNNSRDGLNRELSYPAVHQSPDGTLHVSYTYHRQTIKYVRLPADWTRG